jgi:hypothetical protein
MVLMRALVGDYDNVHRLAQHLKRGDFEIPSHFTLIMRTLLILNGVSHMLAPGERLIAHALIAALARSREADAMPISHHRRRAHETSDRGDAIHAGELRGRDP